MTARTPQYAAALLFGCALCLQAARAGVQPAEEDFQINPPGAAGSSAALQRTRHVDTAADGSFVVVWEGLNGSADPFNLYAAIWARRFDATGTPLTDRLQVNSFTTGNQIFPGVASRPDGSFVVVWQSTADGTINGNDVQARMFGADGTPATDEFLVNTNTDLFQGEPSVDVFDDGGFVVVWTSVVTGQAADIAGQRFDAAGAPVGGEFAVNSYTTLAQGAPQVSTSGDGFVATWSSLDIDDSGLGVVARRFDADGSGIGDDFIVNTYTTFDQENSDVAVAEDGSFVIVWESDPQDGDDEGVFGRRYDADGVPVTDEFAVSVTTSGAQHRPSVHYDADGFVVVWSDEPDQPSPQDPIETVVRCFDTAGNPLSEEISIAEAFDCSFCGTSVARGGTGEYVAVWTGPPDGQFGFAVRGRRLVRDTTRACGDPVASTSFFAAQGARVIAASDALLVLQAAVGAAQCLPCVCDVDASGGVTATDALLVLNAAVGQPVQLTCPAC